MLFQENFTVVVESTCRTRYGLVDFILDIAPPLGALNPILPAGAQQAADFKRYCTAEGCCAARSKRREHMSLSVALCPKPSSGRLVIGGVDKSFLQMEPIA
jgi:hypothetical protein